MFSFKEILSVTLTLFAVIDILGAIPIILRLKEKAGKIESGKATLTSAVLMLVFLFAGEFILKLFGVDYESFSLAGALIMFFFGLEMVLGITLFKEDPESGGNVSIVPLAFPLISGAGTMTTLISLRAVYDLSNICVGIFLNVIFVYIVLKSCNFIERKLGKAGVNIIRKVFGIILLAIAIKIFKSNLTGWVQV